MTNAPCLLIEKREVTQFSNLRGSTQRLQQLDTIKVKAGEAARDSEQYSELGLG